ncbi:hypothetical protein [Persicobacter psychrovividus]|uniref:Uncharacterized protein n=1 Tax=Persicobacter psychrovividus TaxID=387638 RepID=A0ABM7VKP3_9BACT|nr:hypothetical protein PEPS_38310 [Persicobacter psychrovividus]
MDCGKDGSIKSDSEEEAQALFRALQAQQNHNDGFELIVDTYEGGNKGDEAFRFVSNDGKMTQIAYQMTDRGTSHKHSSGDSWSFGGSFIAGVGAEFSVGKVYDGYGNSNWFWNINGGFGFDIGIGFSASEVSSLYRNRPFEVNDWEGEGGGYFLGSENLADLSFAKSWNTPKENRRNMLKFYHATNPRKVGTTYRATDVGIPLLGGFDELSFPVSGAYTFGVTRFFFKKYIVCQKNQYQFC